MSPKKVSPKGPSAERAVETPDSQDKTVAALITEQARETLSVIFAVRFVNSLCVRTFFQPDEYFQVLEPAWQMMYGEDSGAWLTWVRRQYNEHHVKEKSIMTRSSLITT
jgi:GPI mannosyltransferase 3